MLNTIKPILIVTTVAAISACSGPTDRTEITETAQRSEYRAPDSPNATSAERFTIPGMTPAKPVAQTASDAPADKPFHYDVPTGWAELPTTQFRNPNFAIGADGDMECYVTLLPGDGGGVLINANRWREQFGATPYTEEEVAALPDVVIMGHPAKVVNFIGEFKGMGETEAKPDFRLIGAIIQSPEALITIKMTGPAAKLMPELNQFAEFVDSLHANDGHSHDAPTAAPIAADATMPADHPPLPAETAVSTSPAPNGAGNYVWEVPEGWLLSTAGSSMRLITFAVGDTPGKEAECYIVELGGDGGGRLGNYNRWLGQFGQPPLAETELMLQPPVIFFDEEVPMLVCEGSYTGMGETPKDDYMLLGASYEIDGKSLFIKLVGPKETVTSNWNKLLMFCASIDVKS